MTNIEKVIAFIEEMNNLYKKYGIWIEKLEDNKLYLNHFDVMDNFTYVQSIGRDFRFIEDGVYSCSIDIVIGKKEANTILLKS